MQDTAARLATEIQCQAPETFAAAVQTEAAKRMDAFAAGVQAYQNSAPPTRPPAAPVIWQAGAARLFDYGPAAGLPTDAPAILCIPSLINRAYILDLTEHRSLMRTLANNGLRGLLLDWGAPGPAETQCSLADYIDDYLGGALDHLLDTTGRPVSLLGYCMGGNLALGLAARRPADIGVMALLATPWDFHAGFGAQRAALAAMRPGLEMMIAAQGSLAVDLIQALFNGLNPGLAGAKFRALAETDPTTDKFRQFVTLEDWLNDGVPLAGPVARECLFEWYLENTPGAGNWSVNGTIVDPTGLNHRTLVVVPDQDHIVPPASARPLAARLPKATLRTVKAGHIGMVAGGNAPELLLAPLAVWLSEHAR